MALKNSYNNKIEKIETMIIYIYIYIYIYNIYI